MKNTISRRSFLMAIAATAATAALSACGTAAASSAPASVQSASSASSAAAGSKAAAPSVNLGLIASGFGTQSFNDDVKTGMDKCISELGVQGTAIEVTEVSEASNSLRTLIAQGCNYMLIPSAEYHDAMVEVAEEYPDVKFAYLAAAEEGYDNILSVEYRENEGSFLAGALGAMLTKTNVIGAVLAVNEPVQQRYSAGYQAGAKAVNADCKVQVAFTNSYSDVNAGHDMAEAMYKQNADYVGCYAGACNLGVFNAASEAGDGKYAFGAATGQFDKMPDKILASVVKPIDIGVYNLVKAYVDTGTFEGKKAEILGLAEGGIELRFTTMNDELLKSVPENVMSKIETLKAGVVDKSITVPQTEDELAAFTFSSPL